MHAPFATPTAGGRRGSAQQQSCGARLPDRIQAKERVDNLPMRARRESVIGPGAEPDDGP